MKKLLKSLKFIKKIEKSLNTELTRDSFVIQELRALPPNQALLDAGCGNQKYRKYCDHLIYKTQDLGEYKSDAKVGMSDNKEIYSIGPLDYQGNIWEITADSNSFDSILCTEVWSIYLIQTRRLRSFPDF